MAFNQGGRASGQPPSLCCSVKGIRGGVFFKRGSDRWTLGCWHMDCLGGLLVPLNIVVTSPTRMPGNLPTHNPCVYLPPIPLALPRSPLTRMTAETLEQLEMVTLVSREIVCPLCLTPHQSSVSPSLSHSCTRYELCARVHTCTSWQYTSADHSRKASLLRGHGYSAGKHTHKEFIHIFTYVFYDPHAHQT